MVAIQSSPPRSDPVRGLIQAAVKGDQAAVESLVRRSWPDLRRIAYLITQDQAAAEDIAQDSMLAALETLDRFDADRPLQPWLARIATNRSLDWLRRRRRLNETTSVEDTEEDPRLVADTADVMRGAMPADLLAALRGLSPEIRTAIVLRHLLDYEPAEIAELFGVPASTIRSRIHRGLHSLRRVLDDPEKGSNA